MTAEEQIEQVLSGPEPEYSESPVQAHSPEDREAMYLMRRLARARQQRARIEQLFTEVMEELELRRRGQLDPIENAISWLEERLALWHHARIQEDPKATRVHLPTGTLKATKAQPRWEYDAPTEFLAWAKINATAALRLVPAKDEIDRVAAKKLLGDLCEIQDTYVIVRETGEKVPGVRVTPGGDFELGRFYTVEDL